MRSPVVWQPIEDELRPLSSYISGTVLNAGCGNRDIGPFLRQLGAEEVINCDIASSIPGALLSDLRSIPVSDQSVDTVICNAVLEHVLEPEPVMREFRRVLRPGGYAIICIPFLQPYHPCPTDFRRLTAEGMGALATSTGFTVRQLRGVHSLAQTITWILWETLDEHGQERLKWLLWWPLHMWCRVSKTTNPALLKNPNSFQMVITPASSLQLAGSV